VVPEQRAGVRISNLAHLAEDREVSPSSYVYHSTNICICPRMTVSPPIRLCTIEHRT
jgi:hypothetical protein